MRIVISSGHGLYVRGASGLIDEVDEARVVVHKTAAILAENGHSVVVFHDNTSHTQNENLQTIVDAHNAEVRDLDVSVHFNAYVPTTAPRGTEVLYVTQESVAARVAQAIAECSGLVNRGAQLRSDLYFLNKTTAPAILIEVCFVDSEQDTQLYLDSQDAICRAIASAAEPAPPIEEIPDVPSSDALFSASGKMSWFGGPSDTGVAPDEGLAFLYQYTDAPHLFLLSQPAGTTGLARRLNPAVYFVACRWDYDVTPKAMLADKTKLAAVYAPNGRALLAWPADWGPHGNTGRVADLSKGLMDALCLTTDDQVTVSYPVMAREAVAVVARLASKTTA